MEEVENLDIPPAPELALITAVIEARRGDPERREQAIATLFRSFEFERQEIALWGSYRSCDLTLAWINALMAGQPDAEVTG